jgi:PAS domain S-box-containing protein
VAGKAFRCGALMTHTPQDPAKLDLTRAMEDLAAPAYVIDRDGRFRWLNKAYIELFGDHRGRPFGDYVAPEHKQLARTNFARTVVGKTTTTFDLVVFDRGGGRLTLRITSAPLRENTGWSASSGSGFRWRNLPTPRRRSSTT